MPTARANRIDELIKDQIKSEKKFTLADLGKI
jgi:hypothetical protein